MVLSYYDRVCIKICAFRRGWERCWMKKGISALLLIVLMTSLLLQSVWAREIALPETKVDSNIVRMEGNVQNGSAPEVVYGVGERTYYSDFSKKSGGEIEKPNWFGGWHYRQPEPVIDSNIQVERIYDEVNAEGYRNKGSLYRQYKITFFPNSGIQYQQYQGSGIYYPYENLNMGFGVTRDLEISGMETRVTFNEPGDNSTKVYHDGIDTLRTGVEYPLGMSKHAPDSLYPGTANMRYVTGDQWLEPYFFNYSGVGNMPVRAQLLTSSTDPEHLQGWFAKNYKDYDVRGVDSPNNSGGEYSRKDIGSAVTWQTGVSRDGYKRFHAKYEVLVTVKVVGEQKNTDSFSGIVAAYSSWQDSWVVAGGHINGFEKKTRQAETIKIRYKEHFNGLGKTAVDKRDVWFIKEQIPPEQMDSRNLVTLESIPEISDKKYTENEFAITTPVDDEWGIDIETYKNKLNFTPPSVRGYNLRNVEGSNYTINGSEENGIKTITVDVYYDQDIVGGNRPEGGWEDNPNQDTYVKVQYYRGSQGNFQSNEMTRFYVKKDAGKKIRDLQHPVIIPNEGYIFSHWSIYGSTDPMDVETVIDRDTNIVANYSPVISTVLPPEPVRDRYVKVTFLSADKGRFGDNTNPEVKSKEVWVLAEAEKTIGQVRQAIGIDSQLVVTDINYRHTGWDVPDAVIVKTEMTVTATYEEKKVTIPVIKEWTHRSESDVLPDAVELALYRNVIGDGNVVSKEFLKTITLKPDQDGLWKGEFTDIPLSENYVLEEKNIEGYEMTWTQKKEGENISFQVTNRKLPSLSIEKKVPGLFSDHQKVFQINVNLSKNGEAISGVYNYTKGKETGQLTFSDKGSAVLFLRHGQTITIKNLPVGVDYTIEEDRQSAEGYTVSYKEANSGKLDVDTKVEVINTGKEIVPTGIKQNATGIGTTILAVIAAVFLVIGFVKLKERKRFT